MNVVRTAIVGMGIGRQNARGILANPRGRVTALCDLIEERMHLFAEELDEPVKYYVDYKEMCQDPDIDAVMVATPNVEHAPVAMEALKNGKHVLVTKPLTGSAEPARELVELAEASGLVNMMSLSLRFSNTIQSIRKRITTGELGDIYYAHASSIRRVGIPGANKNALHFIQKGGGAFRDMGVPVLDATWFLMGFPKPVSVFGVSGANFGPRGQAYWNVPEQPPKEYYSQFDSDDYGGGFIRFENGVGLQVESHWASHMEPSLQVRLFGTEAGVQLRPPVLYQTVEDELVDTPIEVDEIPIAWHNIGKHFIECILDGVPCRAPLRQGMEVQQMMEGLLKSAETGEVVHFQ